MTHKGAFKTLHRQLKLSLLTNKEKSETKFLFLLRFPPLLGGPLPIFFVFFCLFFLSLCFFFGNCNVGSLPTFSFAYKIQYTQKLSGLNRQEDAAMILTEKIDIQRQTFIFIFIFFSFLFLDKLMLVNAMYLFHSAKWLFLQIYLET